MLRVIIASVDEEARSLLRVILEPEANIAIVGEAETGTELAALIQDVAPHVVLLDMDAPGPLMADAVKRIKVHGFQTGFVGLVGMASVDGALLGEVDILLHKNGPLDKLVAALHKSSGKRPVESLSTNQASLSAKHVQHANGTNANGTDLSHRISSYVGNLERGQRELEERLNLVQFWLQDTEPNGHVQAEGISNNGVTVDNSNGSAPSAFTLSVDGFFNAQHKVTMGGVEGSLHPHSWRLCAKLRQKSLEGDHVLVGFADAKRILREEICWLDGKILNDLPQFSDIPPTTENIAATVFKNLKAAVKEAMVTLESVTVWESPTNSVTYAEALL